METVLLSLDECLWEIEEGRIRDAKTIAGIFLAMRKAERLGKTF